MTAWASLFLYAKIIGLFFWGVWAVFWLRDRMRPKEYRFDVAPYVRSIPREDGG